MVLNIICIAAFVALVAAAGLVSKGGSLNKNVSADNTANVVSDVIKPLSSGHLLLQLRQY